MVLVIIVLVIAVVIYHKKNAMLKTELNGPEVFFSFFLSEESIFQSRLKWRRSCRQARMCTRILGPRVKSCAIWFGPNHRSVLFWQERRLSVRRVLFTWAWFGHREEASSSWHDWAALWLSVKVSNFKFSYFCYSNLTKLPGSLKRGDKYVATASVVVVFGGVSAHLNHTFHAKPRSYLQDGV